MNTGDVRILTPSGLTAVPTQRWNTAAGNTALNPGEAVKVSSVKYVVIVADGDGTTSQLIAGIVKGGPSKNVGDSVTASTDGQVDVYIPLPGVIYAAKAKTATLANTAALVTALIGKRVKFSVVAGKIGVDTAQADAAANGVRIVGGDYQTSTIYFLLATGVTFIGNATT